MLPLRRIIIACAGVFLFAVPGFAQDPAPVRIGLTAEVDAGGQTRIAATVVGREAKPVAGATVTFRAKTAFGWLTLAAVSTDRAGLASVILPAARPYTEVSAETGDEAVLYAAIRLARDDRPRPARRPSYEVLRLLSPQPGFISPYPVLPMLVPGLLLAGIWSTYASMVWLLVRIRRAR